MRNKNNRNNNAKKLDSNYDDCRDIDQEKRTDYNNKKLNMLSIHKDLSKLISNKTQMDFDVKSLYPKAMC